MTTRKVDDMRPWNILLSLTLIMAASLGLLVLSGGAKRIFSEPLEARLVVQEYPIPTGFGIEPSRIAEFMAEKLIDRMDGDIAMRLTLEADARKKVKEIVLPRLMNVVVVQAMMREIPELSAILEIGGFRRSVTGQIATTQALRDVALTVPGALLAEVDGEKVAITSTSTGMNALVLGDMSAGQVHQVTIWLGSESVGVDLGQTVRIGAEGGARGRVLFWGTQGWFGADLEAMRWSRWLIGAILSATLLFGLTSLILPLLSQQQERSRRNQPNTSTR
jgi:hypothetical protein